MNQPYLVSIRPDELAKSIRAHLAGNDELLTGDYGDHPLAGHCFVASEVYYHLSDADLTPMQLNYMGASHWYLRDDDAGRYIDLTVDQFRIAPDHHEGRGRGFGVPGGGPSERAQQVIDALD